MAPTCGMRADPYVAGTNDSWRFMIGIRAQCIMRDYVYIACLSSSVINVKSGRYATAVYM